MARSKWTGVLAFFLGAGLGVVAGMLLAPKSGEDLREDLGDQVNAGVRRVRAAGKSMSRRAQDIAEQVQDTLSDVADAGLRASRKITRS